MAKSTTLLVTLAALLLLGSTLSTVKKLDTIAQKDIFTEKGQKIEIDFLKLFNLSEAEYPLSFESTPQFPWYSFEKEISTSKYEKTEELNISFSTKLDSSRVLVFEKNSKKACLQTFSDVELVAEKSKCFTFGSTKLQKAPEPKPSDFIWNCEDAVYELSAKAAFIICRGVGHINGDKNEEKVH